MRLGLRGIIWLSFAATILVGLLVVVLFRVPIAEAVAGRVLAWRGIDAAFDITTLDFDHAAVERISVGPAATPSIAARRIDARYSPWGLVRGRVREITADGLEVRVTVDAEGARLEGLPTGGGGGRPAAPVRTPHISIPDGRLYVSTAAGELVGDISLVGGPDEGWSARIAAQPASLSRGDSGLELASGTIEATVQNQALSVSGGVRIASLSHAGAMARDVSAGVSFSGSYDDATRLAGLTGDGRATFEIGSAELDAETAAAWAVRLAPITEGAVADVAGAHLDMLRAILTDALRGVSADAELAIAVSDGRATIAPVGDAALTAVSGARIALRAASDVGGAVIVDMNTRDVGARDLSLSASLPGQLDARVIVSEATMRNERGAPVGEAVMTFALSPWAAGGLSLSADGQRLRLARDAGGALTAETQAELRATGTRFGVIAEDLVARVDLDTVIDQNGVTVRPRSEATQQLSAARLTAGGRLFEAVAAGVVPLTPGEPLMTSTASGVDIATRLLDLSAGFELMDLRWASVLPAAELVLRAPNEGERELRFYVQAPRLEGRGEDGREAVVQAGVVDAGLGLEPTPSARLRFEALTLGGSALPVQVAGAGGEFNATLVDGKPYEGRLALTGIDVTDAEEPARLVPVTLSADAPIVAGVMQGTATAVDADGRTIVTAQLRQDFNTEEGALDVGTPLFAFAEDELQPQDVFPTLRRFVVNTTGGSAGMQANLAWDGDGMTSRGLLTLDGITFDMKFGHVGDLSTRFEVADLLNVRTSAPQRITVGVIDPGVPLTDGSLDVELLGASRMRLASARFPFANGSITAAPTEIDFTAESNIVLLLADDISLDALAEMFKPPNLVLQGSLSGNIPIEARGRSVYIVNGQLSSDRTGVIAYSGRAGEGIAQQNDQTKLAFDALSDFQYDRLVLTLNGDVAGRVQANVHIEGKNPAVLEGYPINFNLNTSAEFANLLTQAFRSLDVSAAAQDENAVIESLPADEDEPAGAPAGGAPP